MITPGSVVDSHHHVWDLTVRVPSWLDEEQSWADEAELAALRRSFTAADLAQEAAAAGVTSTVVVQTAAEAVETPELLALAAGSTLIAGVVGWVDLTGPDVAGAIAALREQPGGDRLVGIRHPVLTEPDDAWLARPDVLRGLAAVAQAGLIYDVVCRQQQLPAAVTATGALPGLTFVLDHVGNPGPDAPRAGPWAGAIGALGARPNVVAKLSGILSDAFPGPGHSGSGHPGPGQRAAPGQGGSPVPDLEAVAPHVRAWFDTALRAFGKNRLMFGSDWPVCTLTASYSGVLAAARALTAALSPAEQSAVFAGTARRTYRLGG